MMKRTLFLLALLALAVPPAFGQMKGGNVRAAIEAANREFVAAVNRGDAAAIAAMYTEDARVLPPNAKLGEGREAARQIWQGAISAGLKLVSLETLYVESQGTLAYEVGRYTMTMPSPRGGTTQDVGKYVVVWKRSRGKWLLAADIWNSDAAAQSQ